jgi:uncharacterized protein (DUF305 family)
MNLKIAIFSAGLLCIGCVAPEKYTQQAQTSVKQVREESKEVSQQDRQFVDLLTQHQTIGAQLADQATSDPGSAPIRDIAQKISKESTYELERLQAINRQGPGKHLTAAERPSEAANAQSGDRQHVSGVATNNDSLRNEQSAKDNHSGVAVPDTAASPAGQIGPTAIVSGSAPFAQRWLETMTQHHQAGIQLLQSYQGQLKNDELREYAEKLLEEKQQALSELQNFRPQVGADSE